MSVKIISDSTCDLSPDLIKKYGIKIMPLHIVLGDKEYEDGFSITPDEIYKWSDENNATPKTSAINLEYTMDIFRPIIEAGDEIVCFGISGEMSTTVNVMRLAAEELEAEDRIFIIDSRNLSTGIGLQVIEAAIMAAEGHSAAQIAGRIAEIIPRVRASFVIDTLKYLHRGGRCSGMAAFAGTALKLHPKIVVNEGKMSPTKKYMGNISRVVMNYVREMEKNLRNAETDRVFITHSGCSKAIVSDVRKYLEELGIFSEILETRAGCVVSSHCGPNTLGVLFIEK
ncbi:MAG: DegV family protein [Ruminococcus sp.]|nr:DegV family protein [Ruminococcus sp.]MBO5320763.1 DegV family protein [Ruminococcus sp.]MBQ4534709.1 DegV family protein [Ruminococcus sp.]